ncbi:MAG: TetR/AcrR family transcriptional regulator [Chitinophagales bacterium]|nr:TetR/AcrR family transcriptional regulator [Hyphomicrobiales bacterium]
MIADVAAADTKIRILLEAERLFRVYGYSKTTVADIADACGMSPSNVYRFFASKGEINEAICERILAEKERRLRMISVSNASAADRITAMIEDAHRYTLETMLDDRKVHEMVVVALAEQWSVIEEHLERMTGMMEETIRHGVANGEFRKVEPAVMARCLLASIAALTHPTMVAQCATMENRASSGEMAAFILLALKA